MAEEMLKILVADSTAEFCAAVAEAFEGRYQVTVCHDGKTALNAICTERPDILWLDLMLPRLDGITILQSLALAGISPKVLACSRYFSDYATAFLSSIDACWVMNKPCDLAAALMRIADVAVMLLDADTDTPRGPGEVAYQILISLGLAGKRSGHKCLLSALRLKALDEQLQVTKTLYPEVARECGGTPASVERAIRCVLSVAWEKRNPEIWRLYFPNHEIRCPSNGVFIDAIADRIRKLVADE